MIKDAVCYSDAMCENLGEGIASELIGREYVEGEDFWTELMEMVKKYDI